MPAYQEFLRLFREFVMGALSDHAWVAGPGVLARPGRVQRDRRESSYTLGNSHHKTRG